MTFTPYYTLIISVGKKFQKTELISPGGIFNVKCITLGKCSISVLIWDQLYTKTRKKSNTLGCHTLGACTVKDNFVNNYQNSNASRFLNSYALR